MATNKKLYFILIYGVLTSYAPALAWYDFLWIGYASRTIVGKMKAMRCFSTVSKAIADDRFKEMEKSVKEKLEKCYQEVENLHEKEKIHITQKFDCAITMIGNAYDKATLPFSIAQEKWKEYGNVIMENDIRIDGLKEDAQKDSILIKNIDNGVKTLEMKLGNVAFAVDEQDGKSKVLEEMINKLNTKLSDVCEQSKQLIALNQLLQKKLIVKRGRITLLKQKITDLEQTITNLNMKYNNFEHYSLPFQKDKDLNKNTKIKNLDLKSKINTQKLQLDKNKN